MFDSLRFDLKYAVRALRRAPSHSLVAAAILSAGIGVNTAMFSAVNQVLLRPLPFARPDALVRVRDRVVDAGGQTHAYNMPARHILELRAHVTVFDGVVAFSGGSMTLEGGDMPERVSAVVESDSGHDTLGAQPAIGRAFSDDERRVGLASGVTIISHAMWLARFGGRPDAIGSAVRLDGRTFTVIGVMPARYAFPYDAQFWLPIVLDASDQVRDYAVFARRRPGVTMEQTEDALDAAARLVRAAAPDVPATFGFELMTARENLVDHEDRPLRALTDIVVLLLLVACVNVATLLLARSAARRREFAVRAALGASRGRQLRQLVAESLVLAAIGCAGGLLVAAWVGPITSSLFPHVLRGQLGIVAPTMDVRVLAFAIAVSAASAVVAGVLPAFGNARTAPGEALSDGGRGFTGGPRRAHLLGGLVVAETALTLMLVAGAGLVLRNFARLQGTPLGFDARGLLAIELTFPAASHSSGPSRTTAASRVLDEVAGVSGVRTAAITTVNPLGGGTWGATVITEDASADPNATININHRLVTPHLFETMGIPIVEGRGFDDSDRASTPPVAIVSARLARRAWPGQDALGKRIRIARPGAPWLTVVGVAANVDDVHDPDVPFETWYVPFAQFATTGAAEHVYVMVRAANGDPMSLVAPVERAILAADHSLVPYAPVAMDRYHADSIARERTSAVMMSGLGVFGLLLAALGVYGVMAFNVSQRVAEIGIRMALGATAADILPLVLRRALGLIAAGIGTGMVAAAVLNRVLASVLTEIQTFDVGVVGGAAAMIAGAAVAACLVPSFAAARLDPVAAIKNE